MLCLWRECNANQENQRWIQNRQRQRQVQNQEIRNQTPSGNKSKPSCIQEKEEKWM
jgi:hypothetical protein